MAEEELTEGDEELEDGLEELEPKRLSGKKIVIYAGAGLVLLALAVTGVFLFGGKEKNESGSDANGKQAQAQLIFIDLPELVINLNTGERQARYLRANISLEVASEKDRASVEQSLPRVIDDFQIYLRELRPQDLNGSAGLFRLKEELLVRLNTSVAPAEVKDVLFREMLVQ